MGDVPFREVYVHGLIRDHDGQKMSKSKGNVIDPLDIIDGIDLDTLVTKRTSGLMQPQLAPAIEKATRKQFPNGIEAYGTDALRFTFAALATQSRDIRFDLARVGGYRNFCNKLWNAARYVTMQTQDQDCGLSGPVELSAADRWIRSRCAFAAGEAARGFADYRFDLAAQALYEFTWYEFCDWYLELSKPILQSQSMSAAALRGTRQTLILVLETILRLLHPVMPFITEEIWLKVAPLAGRSGPTIMLEPYPHADVFARDSVAETEMRWVMDFILGVRQIRGEMDIAPSKRFDVLLENASARDIELANAHAVFLERLAQVSSIRPVGAGERAPQSAIALLGGLKILVPMAGLIDVAAERERLDKRLVKARSDLGKCQGKLANAEFVANAPPEVIAKERARVAAFERDIGQIEAQLKLIAALR
jgi:valyl-tRNA synthetase